MFFATAKRVIRRYLAIITFDKFIFYYYTPQGRLSFLLYMLLGKKSRTYFKIIIYVNSIKYLKSDMHAWSRCVGTRLHRNNVIDWFVGIQGISLRIKLRFAVVSRQPLAIQTFQADDCNWSRPWIYGPEGWNSRNNLLLLFDMWCIDKCEDDFINNAFYFVYVTMGLVSGRVYRGLM